MLEYKTIKDIDEFLRNLDDVEVIRTNKKIDYLNIACSFDIETSSIVDYQGNKIALMYVWMLAINDDVLIGRTWNDFIYTLEKISLYQELHDNKRLIIYVHNLSYEFQFFRKWLNWVKVFAIDTRKPVYAICDYGIEFRCSYILSGYSLERLADNLQYYKVRKLVGSLDYKLVRHSETSLTDEELSYCINDVLVVTAYIQERMYIDGDITKLPLTKTGYVRRYCKNNCLGKGKTRNRRYMQGMRNLKLMPDEYKQLRRAFQGGFTHANPFYSGKVIDNVDSYDFTSSYPSVMVSEKFPMSSPENYTPKSGDDFRSVLQLYNVMFDACFEGIHSKVFFDSYISYSRCWNVISPIINNGRIVSADKLYITLTEIDYFIICAMYEWDSLSVAHMRRFKRAYLPTELVSSILTLYENKTKLKNVEGREYDYLKSKEMINAVYGMMVTDICRDEIIYRKEWEIVVSDDLRQLEKYNRSQARFLYYPWGIWVTAYSRRNLFTGILECEGDYVYSDTDSIKMVNGKLHKDYIERYNSLVQSKLYTAMTFHGLDDGLIAPETIEGIPKPLGIWDYEGTYKKFKTLGAKRYITEDEEGIHITVSGLAKKAAIDYMIRTYDDVFSAFTDELYIPKGYTGKLTHTYIDEEQSGDILDYNGKFSRYQEKSSVHLEDADYSLKIGHEYADYILGIQTKEV